MTKSMSRTGRVILSASILFCSIFHCSILLFRQNPGRRLKFTWADGRGYQTAGDPRRIRPRILNGTSDGGFKLSGGIHWSHEENAYSDQFRHYPVNHWDSAYQYTHFSLDADISYFSEVTMDGKTEQIEGAFIEPMAISSVESMNGAPASVYRVNPDAEEDRWFPLINEPGKYFLPSKSAFVPLSFFRQRKAPWG